MYTVEELIEELEKYPRNTIVTVSQTNSIIQHISHTYETTMRNGETIVCIGAKSGNLYQEQIMKCPTCGTEMVWMGNVQIVIRDTDKYFHQLSKKAFRSKDVELWGVDWDGGDLFCPNYLQCGNHPVVRAQREQGET